MRIAVRLDDIAPVMRWKNFTRMMELLESVGAMPLLGVIPDCQDESILSMKGAETKEPEEFRRELQTYIDKGAVIAMHGVHHVYTTTEGGLFPLNRKSEFAGLPLEEQEALLKEGSERMRSLDLPTSFFMAPAHSYDANTLKALGSLGFKRVTDGFGNAPYRYRELTFYPLAYAKERAVKADQDGSVTIVYHTNTMREADFEAAEALFNRARMIPYRELLHEPTVRRSDHVQLIEHAAALLKRGLVKRRKK